MISLGMLRDVWAFRGFIISNIRREFQSRYLGTQFGAFWVVAHPLTMIVIYTVVFANVMKPSLPNHNSQFAFSIYLCAGVITWGLFGEMLGRCVNIFVEHAGILKKVNFPKLCLPIIVWASSWLHFAIILGLFLLFLLLSGNFPGWVILAIVPVLVLQTAFTLGLGVLLATVNVFYRDVSQTVSVVLQFWFWLTPIVYVSTLIPESVRTFLELNPMWPIVRAYQGIFLDHAAPDWSTLVYPAILTAVLAYLGMNAFFRLQGEIVDEL
jgi:lipopolysaccharide transport system permease protein